MAQQNNYFSGQSTSCNDMADNLSSTNVFLETLPNTSHFQANSGNDHIPSLSIPSSSSAANFDSTARFVGYNTLPPPSTTLNYAEYTERNHNATDRNSNLLSDVKNDFTTLPFFDDNYFYADNATLNSSGDENMQQVSSNSQVRHVDNRLHGATSAKSCTASVPVSQSSSLWSPARDIAAANSSTSSNFEQLTFSSGNSTSSVFDPFVTHSNMLESSTTDSELFNSVLFNDNYFINNGSSFSNSLPTRSQYEQQQNPRLLRAKQYESSIVNNSRAGESEFSNRISNNNYFVEQIGHEDRHRNTNDSTILSTSTSPSWCDRTVISTPGVTTGNGSSQLSSLDVLCNVASDIYNDRNNFANQPGTATTRNSYMHTDTSNKRKITNGTGNSPGPINKQMRRDSDQSSSISYETAASSSSNQQRLIDVIVLDDEEDGYTETRSNETSSVSTAPTVINLCESPNSARSGNDEAIEVIRLFPTRQDNPESSNAGNDPRQRTTTTYDSDDDVVFTGQTNPLNDQLGTTPSSNLSSPVLPNAARVRNDLSSWPFPEQSRILALSRPVPTPPFMSPILGFLPIGARNQLRITFDLDTMLDRPSFTFNTRRGGLSKRRIDDLPSHRFDSIVDKDATSDSTCAICMDDYKKREKIRQLPCSHGFHARCVDKWLKQHNSCPICRENVSPLTANGAASSASDSGNVVTN